MSKELDLSLRIQVCPKKGKRILGMGDGMKTISPTLGRGLDS